MVLGRGGGGSYILKGNLRRKSVVSKSVETTRHRIDRGHCQLLCVARSVLFFERMGILHPRISLHYFSDRLCLRACFSVSMLCVNTFSERLFTCVSLCEHVFV